MAKTALLLSVVFVILVAGLLSQTPPARSVRAGGAEDEIESLRREMVAVRNQVADLQMQVQDRYGQLRSEIRMEVKTELRPQLKMELKQELKQELSQELRYEIDNALRR